MFLVDLKKLHNNYSVLLLAGFVLAGCQNAEEKASDRLKQGVELFKKGDYQKAQLELKSAMQADGSLSGSYYYMALLNERDGQYKAMKENLAQAVNLEPSNIDARIKYGHILLIFNEADNALIQAEAVSKLDPANLEAQALKAAVLMKQKKMSEAQVLIEEMLQKNPRYATALSLQIVQAMELKEYDRALKLVNAASAMENNNMDFLLLKIQIDSQLNDVDAVIKDYEQLSALNPDDKNIKIALAKTYSIAKKQDKADSILSSLVSAEPNKLEPKLLYLDFLNSIDQLKAKQQLERYITEAKDKPELLLSLTQWLLSTQQYQLAQKILEEQVDNKQSPAVAENMKLLLAELKFNQKDNVLALKLIEEVLSLNSTNQPAKILKAKILVANKEYDAAIELFNKVLWESPELDAVVVMLGEIELLKHDPEKADKKFHEALEINPTNRNALKQVIQRAIGQGNYKYADSILNKALQLNPADETLAEQLIRVKIMQQDWNAAAIAIANLEKNTNKPDTVLLLKSKIDQEQGKCTEAITGYKKVLEETASNQIDALTGMVSCGEKLQQRSEMLSYLSSYIANHPNIIPAYLLKSQLLTASNKENEAIAVLKQAVNEDQKNASVYMALGLHYWHKRDWQEALKYYQLGLQALPNHQELMLGLAETYEKANDFNNAISNYEKIIQVNPHLDIAINNLATVLVDHFEDEKSVARAKNLVENFKNSDNPYYLDTYGWVEAKFGDINKAITVLEKVNTMSSQTPIFKYHLGLAYLKQGNNAGAAAQLQEAITLGKSSGKFLEINQAEQLLEKLKLTK